MTANLELKERGDHEPGVTGSSTVPANLSLELISCMYVDAFGSMLRGTSVLFSTNGLLANFAPSRVQVKTDARSVRLQTYIVFHACLQVVAGYRP